MRFSTSCFHRKNALHCVLIIIYVIIYIIICRSALDLFYMVISGYVKITRQASILSKSVELVRLGPYKGFGEIALMNDAPRGATVTALEPVECWTIDR